MQKIQLGEKVVIHPDWQDEDSCAFCCRALGADPANVLVDINMKLIDLNQYNSGDNYCFPVGSSCLAKFVKDGVARF